MANRYTFDNALKSFRNTHGGGIREDVGDVAPAQRPQNVARRRFFQDPYDGKTGTERLLAMEEQKTGALGERLAALAEVDDVAAAEAVDQRPEPLRDVAQREV